MSIFDGLDFGSPVSVFLIPVVVSLVLFSVGEGVMGCVSPVFTDTSEFEFDAATDGSGLDSTAPTDSNAPDTGTPPPRDSGVRDSGPRDTGVEDAGARDTGMDTASPSDTMDSGGAQLGACCLRQPTRDVFNICRTSFKGRCDQLGREFRPGGRCGMDEQYPCCIDGDCKYLGVAACDQEGGTSFPKNCTCNNVSCPSPDTAPTDTATADTATMDTATTSDTTTSETSTADF